MRLLWLCLCLLAPPAWGAPDLDATLATARAEVPALEAAVAEAVPRPTRAGFVRFVDPALGDPAAAPFVAARLRDDGDPPEIRAALAEVLGRGRPAGGAWIADQAAVEADPLVRAILVGHLRRADAAVALPALERALSDADPGVRAEAALAVGMHPEGADLAVRLRPALDDESVEVREAAGQALQWLERPE